jgi:hypothetical protein
VKEEEENLDNRINILETEIFHTFNNTEVPKQNSVINEIYEKLGKIKKK